MSTLTVQHVAGDRFEISVRDHTCSVDQPAADHGGDAGPTPTELFVASLTSCVAHYAHRYLVRHELPTDGLSVSATFSTATHPARVDTVDIVLTLPAGVPPERVDALIAVASHCTVHNSLTQPPTVDIRVGAPARS